MKNIVLFLFFTATAAFSSAQKLTMDKVPPAAANSFKVKFPNGSQPGWIKMGAEVYEVQFFNGKKRQSALFDNNGKWLQTQSEANYGAVPGKVQRAFETEFEGYQVQEVYETETHDKGLIYEITAFKGAKNFMAFYSANGELLKKEEGGNE